MQLLFPESVPDLGVSTRVPEVYRNRCMAQGVPTRRELEQMLGDHALLLYAIVIVHRFPSSLPSQALRVLADTVQGTLTCSRDAFDAEAQGQYPM